MKIGLFFGSFNPIHQGHLIVANVIVENSDLDRVWFVVSPQNPFKSSKSLLSEYERLDLVREAVYDNDNLDVTDIEFKMPKPSYTIDTLAYLTDKYPSYEFSIIMGEDNLKGFNKWKNYEQILQDYNVIVYPRPGAQKSDFHSHPSVRMVDSPHVEISATFIRKCLKEKKSVRYMVPDRVLELIESRKLYQE